MDRRTTIIGAVVVLALVGALVAWRLTAEDAPRHAAYVESPVDRAAGPVEAPPEITPTRAPAHAPPTEPALPSTPEGTDPGPAAAAPPGQAELPEDLPRDLLEQQNSAGFRLGQARRRIEELEGSIARFEANAVRLESEGRADVAARQREITQGLRERVETLRTSLPELEAEAQQEGSMGEVQRGFDEGEPGARPAGAPPIMVSGPGPGAP